MAKVALVMHIPEVKADELRQIVRDVDVLDSGVENAIDVSNVKAADVLALILSGQYNPLYSITFSIVEDCNSFGSCGGV